MDLKKNDICVVQITDMNHDGEGIGKLDGCPLFIKDAIVGDTVRVKIMKMKKTYGYARVEEIVESSPFRVEPRCKFYRHLQPSIAAHCNPVLEEKEKKRKQVY